MLSNEIREILEASKSSGWVLEPDTKNILRLSGIDVPRFALAASPEEATGFVREHGFPVAAKVVSPDIMHKSDAGGVVIGIADDDSLLTTFERFRKMKGFTGMLVEEMVSGLEMMAGAKVDSQFGPVILFGRGGTDVEIYKDTAIRMVPLQKNDVTSMVKCLKAHPLLDGYRGARPVNREALTRTLIAFSELVMEMHELIESIDLNPLFCSPERCIVGDARIVLKGKKGE